MNIKIAKQIQAEQRRGRQKFGRGPNDFAHDDSHRVNDWDEYIRNHTARLFSSTPLEWRQRLVKIAGLAVSAIESFDRKRKS